jgi:hypothetical protein
MSHAKIESKRGNLRIKLHSWFSYPRVRRLSAIWANSPTGLGHFDMALYVAMGSELERSAIPNKPYWVLDLGTYFGHSSAAVSYGTSLVSKNPQMRVLSLDIFEQPQWLVENQPQVINFVKEYGSTGPEAIGRRLDFACREMGLASNPIQLMKRDVLTLQPPDLNAIAPEGFRLIMVDCGKTPELMNRILDFLVDPCVTPLGTIVVFQDIFDWHAPWNVYAFWRLLRKGVLSLHLAGPRVHPFATKTAHADLHTVCDRIVPNPSVDELWCCQFTSLENECAALDDFIAVFRRQDYSEFALKLECLKVGAFLRAGKMDQADEQLKRIGRIWPPNLSDSSFQNAFCRVMHLRTGRKDLTLTPTATPQGSMNSLAAKWQRIACGFNYLRPIHSRQVLLPIR